MCWTPLMIIFAFEDVLPYKKDLPVVKKNRNTA